MSCPAAHSCGITAHYEHARSSVFIRRQSGIVSSAAGAISSGTARPRTCASIRFCRVHNPAGTKEPCSVGVDRSPPQWQSHLLSRKSPPSLVPRDSWSGFEDQWAGRGSTRRSWQRWCTDCVCVWFHCQRCRDPRQRHRFDGDRNGITPPDRDTVGRRILHFEPGTQSPCVDVCRVSTTSGIRGSLYLDRAGCSAALCHRGRI